MLKANIRNTLDAIQALHERLEKLALCNLSDEQLMSEYRTIHFGSQRLADLLKKYNKNITSAECNEIEMCVEISYHLENAYETEYQHRRWG